MGFIQWKLKPSVIKNPFFEVADQKVLCDNILAKSQVVLSQDRIHKNPRDSIYNKKKINLDALVDVPRSGDDADLFLGRQGPVQHVVNLSNK